MATALRGSVLPNKHDANRVQGRAMVMMHGFVTLFRKHEASICYTGAFILVATAIVTASLSGGFGAVPLPPTQLVDEPIASPKALRKRAAHEYDVIVERNVFAALVPQPKPAPPDPTPPLQTPAPTFTLVGTIVSQNSGIRVAVMQDSATSKDSFYYEGDRLGPVQIVQIKWNEVIIVSDGRKETIFMRSDQDKPQGVSGTEQRPTKTAAASRRARPLVSGP